MAGRVKQLIDELCQLRSGGNPGVEHFVRASLVLRGINPEDFDEQTPDDVGAVRVLREMIRGFEDHKKGGL